MKYLHSVYLILLTILSLSSYAQKPQAYWGITAGASLPLGDFANDNLENNGDGFAKTGFSIKTSYDHRITYNFGISGLLLVHSNPWDDEALLNSIDRDSVNVVDQLSVSTSNWSSIGILLGPFLYVPVNDLLNFEIKATIGFYNAYAPEIVISGTRSNGENYSLRFLKYSDIGFAWNLGSTIRYNISGTKYLTVSGDYLSSTIKFDNIERFNENGVISRDSFEQVFTTFNITAGIGFAF